MIQIYDIGNENYDRNGNAVLTPTAGRVTMQAGGACDISLTLPMDPEGKWRHVVPGAVVKAPVPREVIENSFSGYAADIYKTVGAADLREDKVAPTPISYPQWNAMDMTYHVGSRVSCYGWPHQNYECTYFDNSSPITQVPPYNSAWWKPIADYTPGAAVVVSLPAGSELYWIENAGSGWYKMSTYYGLTGYIQTSAVVFDRHVSETENQPRIITEQLFRLREPSINNETRTVTVTGQHVSYDLAGILCKNITITQASPAMAMGRVVENMMMDYRGTIATNLTSEENGTYTGKTNGKNGMFMLLDPDAGIVHAFNAKFTRDNWDVFVMKKTSALSGFRISYAKNMRGVTWKKSSAGLVTRVVPVAKNTDGEDLYLPEKWVDSAHIAEYPVILMELLRISAQVGRDDGTGTDTVWTESALFDYMREKAGERFSVDHVDEVVDDLTVQFEQLGDTAEYEWIRPLESVLLYDNIVCQDRDIGLEKVLTVTELEWDPIRRKVTGIKLSNITGAAGRTVTGFNVQNNSITPAKLTEEVTQEIVGQVQALIPDYTDPQAGKYTLPPASSTDLGGIKIGFQASGKNYPVALDANNKAYVYVPWDPGSYTLPLAQDGVRGGIQIGFTASGKNYPVALSGEKAYVYVPWTADGGNAATVNGHSVNTDVPAGAVFTDHYDWNDITNKPATATRWPTWAEVTGKPSGTDRQYWQGDNTWQDQLKGVLYTGCADPNGTSDKPWHLVAEFSQSVASIPLNTGLQLLAYSFYDPKSMGILEISCRWNTNGTAPEFFTAKWLVANNNVVVSDFVVTYNYNSSTKNVTLRLYVRAINWQTHTFTRLSENYWAQYSNRWTIYNVIRGTYASIPANEVQVESIKETLDNYVYWDRVLNKPGSFYTLPLAGNGTRGGIQIGFQASGKNYPVALSGEKAYVYVPWTADGGNAATVNGHSVNTDVPAGAVFTDHYDWSDITNKPATATRWPTWTEVTDKPATATRWPTWDEVTGKPSGMDRQYWQGDNTWQDQLKGVLYTGSADPNGTSDKPWHLVAEFSQSVASAQINTGLQLLAYSSYEPKCMGILEISCRWNINRTAPDFFTAKWLVANSAVAVADFVVTYNYNSSTKNVTLRFYVRANGWQTHTFTRLSENSWAAYSNRWTLYNAWKGTYASIPANEVQVESIKETLDNYVYWSQVLQKPNRAGSNTDGGDAINSDKVDGFHGVDLLTEVDSQKHRLQIRTGSGNLANNTDTYIAFSTPFSTLCAAVVPVSTSGFNAPNALSIVSNNKNGVTLKQNNTLGVSMNVIVVAFGY